MQLTHIAERLMALGFTEKQSRVYVSSLFLGPDSAQHIAQQAGLNRPTTYDILEELGTLGLVSRTNESGKTLFVPSGIEGLKDLLDRQARDLKQRQDQLDELSPELEQVVRTQSQTAPVVRFVHGKDGVDSIWAYVQRKARPGTQVLGMTNHDETLRIYPDHLESNSRLRLNKGLSSRQFYYNSRRAVPSDPNLLKETVRLTEPIPADLTLYEDKAVLLSYGEKGSAWTGVLLENKDIVATLRRLFELAWDKSSKTDKKSVDSI